MTAPSPPQPHGSNADDARPNLSRSRHKRAYNLRRIKATWPYTVQEIAELFGIHKNAVLRWVKDGMQADRGRRPFLIRGDELIRFLSARQAGKRRKCMPTEFYCFKCRAPREGYLGIADVAIESPTLLRVKALCAACGTSISKVQTVRDLPKIKIRFHVQQLTGEHVLERAGISVNSDLEQCLKHAPTQPQKRPYQT